jgi:hypothetical protein
LWCRYTPPASDPVEPQRAAARQFSRQYVRNDSHPDNLVLLNERLEDLIHGKSKYYAPWLTIIQSSSTGKTRSVFELAEWKKMQMFYVCKRMKGDTGYPPSTNALFDLLHAEPQALPGRAHDADLMLYCRFASFMLQAWRYAASGSGDFAGARDGSWIKDEINALAADTNSVYLSMCAHAEKEFVDVKKLATHVREEVADAWIEGRTKSGGKRDFMIVVDESRHFAQLPEDTCLQTNPLLQLGRASRLLKRLGGVLVTMDTFSEVIALTPPEVFPSARAYNTNTTLMIYTDLLTRDIGYQVPRTVREALSPCHILTTGRPPWSSVMLTETNPEEVYNFIISKLLCRPVHLKEDLSPKQAAAVICSRVGLDPSPYSSLGRELVGSHLAYLDYFDYRTGMAVTSYPADAALAHASRLLWQDQDLVVKALQQVNQLLRARVIDHGERGELVAQIVLLLVADTVTAAVCYPHRT